ncbi:MAG: glycosyltransferase [Solirubrobacteraceae bacterium]
MRLAVYCDYSYRVEAGRLYAELPVSLFLSELAPHCERLVMAGRLDPRPGRYPYAVGDVDFAPLLYYASGAKLGSLLRVMPSGIVRFWRLLDGVDVAWVLGPTPLALVFAILTLLRRRRLVLGVRQDTVQLFRHRYPDKRLLRWGAVILEGAFRALARRVPVVVVGPGVARRYRRARALHTVYVSLLSETDILAFDDHSRSYDGPELHMLSVGRLDPEKNPLLLADVFAQALRTDPRWRLDVCGKGPLSSALAQRLEELGVVDCATLHGHVPIDGGLLDLYRNSHAFIHVSLTEGVPAVLLEAFATRLPVVATAVGGVPDLVRDCGLLIRPRDAGAAVDAVETLISNPELRGELVERAVRKVLTLTREAECARLAGFLAGADR